MTLDEVTLLPMAHGGREMQKQRQKVKGQQMLKQKVKDQKVKDQKVKDQKVKEIRSPNHKVLD